MILLLLLPDNARAIGGRMEIQIPRSDAHPKGLWLGSHELHPSAHGKPPVAACMVALAQALALLLEADEVAESFLGKLVSRWTVGDLARLKAWVKPPKQQEEDAPPSSPPQPRRCRGSTPRRGIS
jgi:hypothetical protein